jgi:hypothetical protein
MLNNKHFGPNKLKEILSTESAFVEIFKYFMTVYLKCDYLMHIMMSPVTNKD